MEEIVTVEVRIRYSDEKLVFFKKLIEEKIEKFKISIDILINSGKNLNGTDDTGMIFNALEVGADARAANERFLELNRLYDRQIQLEHALLRIAAKTFGFDQIKKRLISEARLIALPWATTAI